MGFLDLLFPKRCVGCKKFGSYLCKKCIENIQYWEHQVCPECLKPAVFGATHPSCFKKHSLDGLVSLTKYSSPVKELIHEIKYRFAHNLESEVSEKINVEISLPKGDWLLIPLPLSRKRELFRGFNQAEILGRVVAKKIRIKVGSNYLIRVKTTLPQVGLNRAQRIDNLNGAFKASFSAKDKDFLLFDDVWTSGSTLKSAAYSLKKAGAKKVWGLTFSRPG